MHLFSVKQVKECPNDGRSIVPLAEWLHNECVCGKNIWGWYKLEWYLSSCWNNFNQSYFVLIIWQKVWIVNTGHFYTNICIMC